jgi:hypothetical protein
MLHTNINFLFYYLVLALGEGKTDYLIYMMVVHSVHVIYYDQDVCLYMHDKRYRLYFLIADNNAIYLLCLHINRMGNVHAHTCHALLYI